MSSPLITKNFDTTWRQVAPRVEAALRSRGTDPDTTRDICQEVALRLFTSDTDFEDEEHVLRWCHVAARRLAANHYRRQARVLLGAVPDVAGGHETHDVVSSRLAVTEVARALSQLTDVERAALLEEHVATDRKEQVREAVRRHRARKRLLEMVGGVFGWFTALPVLRRLLKPHVLAIALLPVVLTLALLPHEPDPSPEPVVRPVIQEVPGDTWTTTTTTARPSSATSAGPTTTTTTPPSDLPLAPLHGTFVPIADDGHVLVRLGRDEPVFCLEDDPLLGDVCLLG